MRFIIVLFVFAFIACKNGSKTLQNDTAPIEKTEQNAVENETSTAQNPNAVQPIDLSKLPAVSASKKAYMATNHWACAGAEHPTDDSVANEYRFSEITFSEDMTFQANDQGEPRVQGTWGYDEEKMLVYLSSTDLFFNTSFKVKEAGFRMVWIGNTDINKTGVMMRWDNHK